jgi:hypothetical protein
MAGRYGGIPLHTCARGDLALRQVSGYMAWWCGRPQWGSTQSVPPVTGVLQWASL